MAEQFRYFLELTAGTQHNACTTMTQIMEFQPLYPGPLYHRVEYPRTQRLAIQRLPQRIGKDGFMIGLVLIRFSILIVFTGSISPPSYFRPSFSRAVFTLQQAQISSGPGWE